MPKRKTPEPSPEEQFQRFIETAKQCGLDETGEGVDKIFKRIAPKRPQSRPRPTK